MSPGSGHAYMATAAGEDTGKSERTSNSDGMGGHSSEGRGGGMGESLASGSALGGSQRMTKFQITVK